MCSYPSRWVVGSQRTQKDKKLKDIPVVITSVLNEESMANSLGADDYMKKPIDRTFFINIVKRYITEKIKKF